MLLSRGMIKFEFCFWKIKLKVIGVGRIGDGKSVLENGE